MHRHWLLLRGAWRIPPPIGWRPRRRGGTRLGGAVQAGLPRGISSASGACGERRAPGGRFLGPGGARSAPHPTARVFLSRSPSFHFLFLPKGLCSVLPLTLRSHSAANSYSSFKTRLWWCVVRGLVGLWLRDGTRVFCLTYAHTRPKAGLDRVGRQEMSVELKTSYFVCSLLPSLIRLPSADISNLLKQWIEPTEGPVRTRKGLFSLGLAPFVPSGCLPLD